MSLPGRLIESPVGRLFVHQGGSGPPLLLVHGLFVSHYYFKPVIADLERRFTVYAIDLPGSGESDRPDPSRFAYDAPAFADVVDGLMGLLDLPSAHVLGHSMGGGVAVALAARHPDRVQRLVVEDGWVYRMELTFLARLALLPGIGRVLFERAYSRRDLERHFQSVYHDKAVATPELVDYYWERFNRPGARRAGHACLRSFAAIPEEPSDPARIVAPTLLLWGEGDGFFPLAHARRLEGQVRGAGLTVVPACGHSPHEERPDEFLRAVVPFLEGGDESKVQRG